MTDHALEVFRHAAQSGASLSDVRQAVRDYLDEKETHLGGLALDRYMSRLADIAWAELKVEIAELRRIATTQTPLSDFPELANLRYRP